MAYDYEFTKKIDRDNLNKLPKEEQIGLMKQWFFENYQNPVDECPYDSSEGGYIYIWGGPYDAKEELMNEFGNTIDEAIIDDLVSELENTALEWSGISTPELEPIDYLEIFKTVKNPLENLKVEIKKLQDIISMNVESNNERTLYMMSYAHGVTALETFLSDYFANKILNSDSYLRQFVEGNEDFKKETFPLCDIYKKGEDLKNIVNRYIANILWHNLAKVSKLYLVGLKIKFPDNLKELYEAISIRHNIVHRCGKNKTGNEISISKVELQKLFTNILNLAKYIEDHYIESDVGDF